MALDKITYAAAKKYVDKSIAGGGISAGKNCTIDNISPITGGNRVTFKWTLDDGTVQTNYMDVMDGDKGETGDDGLGIKSVDINTQNHLIITFDDDTTRDAGELPGGSGEVISVNGKKGVVTLDANDVGALPDDTELFSGDYNDLDNLPDLTNFITNTVDNLVNYYKKTETYTKTEVDGIVETIKNGRFEVVFTLPTTDIKTNVIYLVPKPTTQTSNIKDEYINLDGTSAGWEKIGDTEIDLSGYVTTTALNTALADYTTTTDLTTLLADKVDKVTGKGLSTNDYTNTDKELVDSIPNLAPISLLKDTIHGVNLLKNKIVSQTINGITWTLNADGTITANGTAESQHSQIPITFTFNKSFDAIFSGCPAGGGTYASSKYDIYIWDNVANERAKKWDGTTPVDSDYGNTDQEVKIVAGRSYFMTLRVFTGQTVSNLVFKPMLRKADIENSTYHPYNEQAIQNQLNAQGVLGAKNIADESNIEAGKAWNGDTNSARARWIIPIEDSYEYIASISGTNSIGYIGYVTSPTIIPSAQSLIAVSGFPVKVTPNSGDKYVIFGFNKTNIAKSDVEALKFMLRLASDPDDTYVPYAMTNRELTEKVKDTDLTEVSSLLDSTYVSSCGSFRYKVRNGICFVYINNIKFTSAAIDLVDFVILSEGVLPRGLIPASSILWNKTVPPLLLGLIRNNDGDIKVTVNGVNSDNVNLSWYAASFSYPVI